MRNELELKLYKDFPLLYGQHSLPMSQTCMCWGFSHSDGWYDLVYELSEKLEKLIHKQIEENNATNAFCMCGCHISKHDVVTKKCNTVYKIPFGFKNPYSCFMIPKSKFLYFWKHVISKTIMQINRFLSFVSPIINKKKKCCFCNVYEPYHASATQVKEKYGYLHFYLEGATNEMIDLINEYENKSALTCEICGKPGTTIEECNWLYTLCNDCKTKQGIEN